MKCALFCVLAPVAVLAAICSVPLKDAVLCYIAFTLLLSALGYGIGLRFAKFPGGITSLEGLFVGGAFGILLLPVVGGVAAVAGGVETGCLLVSALSIFVSAAMRKRSGSDEIALDIPNKVYFIAFCSALLTAAPLRYFSYDSLVREMFSDVFQRFGVIRAIANHVPPENPFFSGASLSYYWLGYIPSAFVSKLLGADLISVWKSFSIYLSVLSVLFFWVVMRRLFREERPAWWGIILLFCFSSYEFWISPMFRGILTRSAQWSFLDPDHVVGIVTTYSDQLLLEDFLYIHHNTEALLVVMSALLFLKERRLVLAAAGLSALAGINPFLLPPALGGFLLVAAPCVGLLGLGFYVSLIGGLSAFWLSLCSVIKISAPITSAVVVLSVAGAHFTTKERDVDFKFLSIVLAGALLLALFLIELLTSQSVLFVFLINYGPAFLFALAAFGIVVFKKKSSMGFEGLIFLSGYILIFMLVTVFLSNLDSLGSFSNRLVGIVGPRVELFNFYHKAGKFIRVAICFMGGSVFVGRVARTLGKIAALLLVIPAIFTGVGRTISYMHFTPSKEREIGRYLRNQGANLDDVLAVENFRSSELPLLAPVTYYYYSSWSKPLAEARYSKSWATQFLPATFLSEANRREAKLSWLFEDLNSDRLREFLRTESIDYLVTDQVRPLEPCARELLKSEGETLYAIRDDCKS